MNTLITGGAGFAGSYLAEHLLGHGHNVILLARPEDSRRGVQHLLSQVRLEIADLRDFARLRQVLSEIRPERVYHLAAFSSVVDSFQRPRECHEVNFGGTLNLLEAWRQLEFETRILVVSSSDVYGRVHETELPLREDSQLRPASPYAASKAAAEFLAIQSWLSYGLPVVRVRPFHHTGPRQSPAFVCSDLARQVAEVACGVRSPVVFVGNAAIRRDFCDVRDIVRGYALLLDRGRPGEVYQLCSGRAVSIQAITEILAARAPVPIEVRADAQKVRSGESPGRWGDPTKARVEVGWEPAFSLEVTLAELEAYWERQIREDAARSEAQTVSVKV
ncbi:MAG TPA: GDP-mannose 4,6-dehydratase [Terriglobia bacterium]